MQPGERNIFERGCLRAGEEWIESNLVPVAGVKVGIMVLQVIIFMNFFKIFMLLHSIGCNGDKILFCIKLFFYFTKCSQELSIHLKIELIVFYHFFMFFYVLKSTKYYINLIYTFHKIVNEHCHYFE